MQRGRCGASGAARAIAMLPPVRSRRAAEALPVCRGEIRGARESDRIRHRLDVERNLGSICCARSKPLGADPAVAQRTERIRRAVQRLTMLIENILVSDRLQPENRDLCVKRSTRGDRALLEIALQNLMQNALKYSPPSNRCTSCRGKQATPCRSMWSTAARGSRRPMPGASSRNTFGPEPQALWRHRPGTAPVARDRNAPWRWCCTKQASVGRHSLPLQAVPLERAHNRPHAFGSTN